MRLSSALLWHSLFASSFEDWSSFIFFTLSQVSAETFGSIISSTILSAFQVELFYRSLFLTSVACFVSVWMMNNNSFGRKGSFIFGLACCAISQLLRVGSLIINSSLCAMIASYLGLFGAMGSMAVGQAYTSGTRSNDIFYCSEFYWMIRQFLTQFKELFPTTVRIKATAVIYTGAMGGSFLVPIWMVMDSYIPWLATTINFTMMSIGGNLPF